MKHIYQTLFLRADTKEAITQYKDLPCYSFRYLGKISRPTGEVTTETVDGEEIETPIMEELEGFHANVLVCTCCMMDTINALEGIRIADPSSPTETFA